MSLNGATGALPVWGSGFKHHHHARRMLCKDLSQHCFVDISLQQCFRFDTLAGFDHGVLSLLYYTDKGKILTCFRKG